MKTISFLCGTDIFPIRAGHHKLMVAICKYLRSQKDVRLKFVLFTNETITCLSSYAEICDEFVQIQMPEKWGIYGILNKIVSRFGPLIFSTWFLSLGLRGRIAKAVDNSELVILNYTGWAAVLSKKLRKTKSIVVTHDIIFHRIKSFHGNEKLAVRLRIWLNRVLELSLLKTFRRVVVLGRYEKELLAKHGFPPRQIMMIGMPIEVEASLSQTKNVVYDFITIGSNIEQNILGVKTFFDRVAPLLDGRTVTFAVMGTISNSEIWSSSIVPSNVKIVKLGYVDDVSKECAKALIGVGTVPHGSGIKVKNVEMAMNGLAMLVTDSGEEGIPLDANATINIDRLPLDEVRKRLLGWLENPQVAIESGRMQGFRLRQDFSTQKMFASLRSEIDLSIAEVL